MNGVRGAVARVARALRRNPATALAVAVAVALVAWAAARAWRRREGLASDAGIPDWKYAGYIDECNYYTTGNGKCKSWTTPTGAYGSSWKGPFAAYHCAQNKHTYKGANKTCVARLQGSSSSADANGSSIKLILGNGNESDFGSMPRSGNLGRLNDAVEKVRIPAGMRITLYQHENQGGKRLALSAGSRGERLVDLRNCDFDTGACGDRNVCGRRNSGCWNDSAGSYTIP